MNVRPYVLLRDSDRATLRARLAAALSAWCEAWLPAGAEATLEACEILGQADPLGGEVDDAGDYWQAESAAGDVAFAGLEDPGRLVDALLGAPAQASRTAPRIPAGLELALLERAVADLLLRLVGEPGTEPGPADAATIASRLNVELGPGAPGAAGQVLVAGVPVLLVLSPGVVRALSERVPAAALAPAGGLEARIEALGTVEDSHLRATARLGEVELTVGDLASLNVGDVIRLDTQTNEPVKLELTGTGRVLDASLGTIAGQPALQIRGRAGSGDKNQVTEGR